MRAMHIVELHPRAQFRIQVLDTSESQSILHEIE